MMNLYYSASKFVLALFNVYWFSVIPQIILIHDETQLVNEEVSTKIIDE